MFEYTEFVIAEQNRNILRNYRILHLFCVVLFKVKLLIIIIQFFLEFFKYLFAHILTQKFAGLHVYFVSYTQASVDASFWVSLASFSVSLRASSRIFTEKPEFRAMYVCLLRTDP